MTRHHLLIVLFILLAEQGVAQSINHWETVVYDSMKWRYWPGTSAPGVNWQTPGFNDQQWQEGRGGIGYGDGDDRTVISPVLSVFLRKKFTITNRDKIKDALLHVDYDDGFIAYLNGVEVARAFMPEGFVAFNQGSAGLHEAQLYQGQTPDAFMIRKEQLDGLLTAGENTLAIQIHNDNVSSSDLSARVFFSLGVTDNSSTYLQVPNWFIEPINFSDSNLPIIVINTDGIQIPDDPRIIAHMGIIDNGPGNRNELTDAFNNYDGRISIETRGESSQYFFPKKSYSLETQNPDGSNFNASLLGMPPENDWVLYAPYTDKTMLRDVLAFQIGRDLGNYASRTRFVEVVINDDYKGVYVLMEKVKRDKNRVDIATLLPQDIRGDELTGGYLLRVDKLDANDYPGWKATPAPQLPGENDITFQFHDPAGEEMVDAQQTYIIKYIREFQNSLTTTGFTSPSGYQNYLDVPSALNFILVNEIGKNIDSYIFSTYLYKEKDSDGGKLHLGPLWDFNLAFGNVDYLANAQFAPGWMWDDQYRMFWFRRMVSDPWFANRLNCRWQELRRTFLTNDYFTNKIDSIASVLSEAQVRNYQRWPIIGTYVWPNQFIGQTYLEEIDFLKQWILNRLTWMDTNMPGKCSVITATEDVETTFQVYPNPFDESVLVRIGNYDKPNSIKVYNLLGKMVFSIPFGSTEYEWRGHDDSGHKLASGIYFLHIVNAENRIIHRVKLLRK